MCLIPGVADGRLLIDRELISEDEATRPACGCANHVHGEAGEGGLTRRRALGLAAGSAAGLALGGLLGGGLPPRAEAASNPPVSLDPASPAQVVFLGTNGGPVISQKRMQVSSALVVNGVVYLVDMGGDTIQQLAKAEIPLTAVRHAFITHYHSDHVSGWPVLAMLGYQQIVTVDRLDVWGPTAASMHRSMRRMFEGDIASREFVAGQEKFDDVFFGHDVHLPRERADGHPHRGRRHRPREPRIKSVFQDKNVKVSATRVYHGSFEEMPYAYGYRFDIRSGPSAGKSVVFSGDTAPTDNLADLADGCDLLVHEAIHHPSVEEALQSVDPAVRDGLREHIFSTHTNIDDIPLIAQESNTKRVALTHISPGYLPGPVWVGAAQAAAGKLGYTVDVTAPNDLDLLTV